MTDTSTTYRFIADDESRLARLDKFLAAEIEEEELDLSRERLKQLILEGLVQVNGKAVMKPSTGLQGGDMVALTVPEAKPLNLAAEPIPLDVVYEDGALLVVNKPAGMLTHPTGRTRTGTLVNALLSHCGDSLSGINGVIRLGIVHRLDRDTSGLLVVAKTDAAHHGLATQIKTKTARREYFSLVQGKFETDAGTVDAPIGRNPKQRDKMCVTSAGRSAVTHWDVTERLGDKFAWLRLRLETGRTHQIRVHMAHIGHPVFGDPLYGSGLEKILKITTQGQCLQAFRLGFTHPVRQEPMTFEIPPDPELLRVWGLLKETL